MPATEYRMQMQFDVTADPGQSFTLTVHDVTIETAKVHVEIRMSGREGGKPPHCEVFFEGWSADSHVAEVFVPGRKVAGSGFRLLPDAVLDTLREVAPEAVRDALAERPAKKR